MREIIAYTDGSAVVVGKNAGHGGFGTYFPDFYGKKLAYSLGFENTKTGRMEVMALYYAINAIHLNHKEKIKLTVYSDSQYVVKTFTEKRLEKWMANNWISYGAQIKNVDLWTAIHESLCKRAHFLTLNMKHIKGHQLEREDDPEKRDKLKQNPHIIGNAVADRLADHRRHKKLLKNDTL